MSQPALTIDLDDSSTYRGLDSHQMLRMTVDFPEQCEQGLRLGEGFSRPRSFRPARSVVVCGLGGSAIGGELAGQIFEQELPVPWTVNRGYFLPSFVDERTLVVCVSYSGSTEETLSAFQEAMAKGSMVAVITSGGTLLDQAREKEVPAIVVPGGQPPRASTGYLLMAMVPLLHRVGLIGEHVEDRLEAIRALKDLREEIGPEAPTAANPAKALAHLFRGRMAFIYGSAGFLSSVAHRWRTQLNENAKQLAISNELPELNHNEVVGWETGKSLVSSPVVVLLRRRDEYERMQLRYQMTKRLLADKAEVHEAWTRGESALAQALSITYLGDFASIYLAFLNGLDPFEIKAINLLKAELAKS